MADVQRQRRGERPSVGFLSVPAAARYLGLSVATLYRSIAENQFPAVRVRTRVLVPVEALDQMRCAALETRGVVDAADWVRRGDAA